MIYREYIIIILLCLVITKPNTFIYCYFSVEFRDIYDKTRNLRIIIIDWNVYFIVECLLY